MTFAKLVDRLEKNGCNLAEVAIGSMMDIIEEQTGTFPNWTDNAPDWVIKTALG